MPIDATLSTITPHCSHEDTSEAVIVSQQPQISDGLDLIHTDHDTATLIRAIRHGQRFHDPNIAREDYLAVDESYRPSRTTIN